MRIGTAQDVKREYPGFAELSTIYRMAAEGVLPSLRFGKRHVRFDLDRIAEWLESRIEGGETAPGTIL